MLTSISFVRSEQNANTAKIATVNSSADMAIAVSEENDVQLLLTGYWYEMPIQFRSHGLVKATSIGYCNTVQPQDNTRLSWYMPNSDIHSSALLIDRAGPDAGFWSCSDDQLQAIYGEPSRVVYIDGSHSQIGKLSTANDNKLQMWLYNYDLRTKITKKNFNETLGTSYR